MTSTTKISKYLAANNIEHKIGHDFFDSTPTVYIKIECTKQDKWGNDYLAIDWDLANKIQRYAKRTGCNLEYRASYTAIALIPQ